MPDIAAAGREVCEALGLDPYKVRSIALRFAAGELPTAEVEILAERAAAAVGVAAGELPTAEVEILAEVEPGAWDVVLSRYTLRYTLRPADEES